ncbi:MAG: U32 family peptidase [Nitrospiraceae bacterium]|nr:MAG: U32 family peptidase [Nitrospiraceae bacterium]
MKKPELLAPAGNFEKLVTALHYGADAVYMGISELSLRARADNFTFKELQDAAGLIRRKGKKLYITVNIFPHNRDIAMIRHHLHELRNIRPDGIIISDPGVVEMAIDSVPEIPVHISTQANITNHRAARFWEQLGARRLVLARELSLDEIKEIRDNVSIDLECFVHGAICISYSGRCYISSFLANRSGNLGECTNSCRWNYTLMEEMRPEERHPVYENDRGTYVMSSRDLCMIEHLDKLYDAGINSFKIEGRMKGINYVAGVVKTYREAIDGLHHKPYKVSKQSMNELSMFSSRGYTTGMFFGKQPDRDYNHDEKNKYSMSHELVGIVTSLNNGHVQLALRNTLKLGDTIQFLSHGIENRTYVVDKILSREGLPIESARNEQMVIIPSEPGVRANDLVRRPVSP